MSSHFSLDFPHAQPAPDCRADFRVQNADFRVEEILPLTSLPEGEHVYLHLEKAGQNTRWVASQLARFAGVGSRDLGWCGLKDRHAVTTQWFSIHLPGRKASDWQTLDLPGVRILESRRGPKKLRPGDHSANRFTIRLRQLRDSETNSPDREWQTLLAGRLENLRRGVPNYFGEQRFGINGNNLVQAEALLVNRQRVDRKTLDHKKRGLIISAARSWLFNQVLAARITDGSWQTRLAGDPAPQPSGPLWGRGRSRATEDTLDRETRALAPFHTWCEGLEHVGLQQERRPLLLVPRHLNHRFLEMDNGGMDLVLTFELGPGEFATSVLRELVRL